MFGELVGGVERSPPAGHRRSVDQLLGDPDRIADG
jgi:hypothetical protein